MKCPHCLVDFHDKVSFTHLGKDSKKEWGVARVTCSACGRFVISLVRGDYPEVNTNNKVVGVGNAKAMMVYPKGVSRSPVPADVPETIAVDYREACLVIADSPKASAALSRRCLQHVLRTAAGVKPSDLAKEIQQVLDEGKLPTHLADSIDAVRNIGNFSAHPMKSTTTGEILPVEPHEADWNLEVLESLFDFYYVQPAATARKRAALNAKLGTAGKPPLKG